MLVFDSKLKRLNLRRSKYRLSSHSGTTILAEAIRIQKLIRSLKNGENSVAAIIEPGNNKGIIREYDDNVNQIYNF